MEIVEKMGNVLHTYLARTMENMPTEQLLFITPCLPDNVVYFLNKPRSCL